MILGVPGSGRREVLYDLIEGGIAPKTPVLCFYPEDLEPSPFDEKLAALPNVNATSWQLNGVKVRHGRIEAEADVLFFVAPGTADPADAIEALDEWIRHNDCQLGRILTVVHCSFLKERHEATAWYDACIHFSDIVLLNRRESVDNKWVKTFEERYTKQHYPCLFELVKKGRVENPARILDPEARRLSLFFDELIPIEEDEFEDEAPEDTKPDPYIERLESGRRARPIPEISKFLGSNPQG